MTWLLPPLQRGNGLEQRSEDDEPEAEPRESAVNVIEPPDLLVEVRSSPGHGRATGFDANGHPEHEQQENTAKAGEEAEDVQKFAHVVVSP